MSESTYCRSPQLMNPEDTLLLFIDIQQKLLPSIQNKINLQWNAERLLEAADLLDVPCIVTEQYPKGLGATEETLLAKLEKSKFEVIEKVSFSCLRPEAFRNQMAHWNRPKVLVCGIESHVCVQQTVFDLMAEGISVFVAVDAVGSRNAIDHDVALRRMENQGATLTTTEAAIFEWCTSSKHPAFKQVQKLIKIPAPEA